MFSFSAICAPLARSHTNAVCHCLVAQGGINAFRVLFAPGRVPRSVLAAKGDPAVTMRPGDVIELDGFKAANPARYAKGPEAAFELRILAVDE